MNCPKGLTLESKKIFVKKKKKTLLLLLLIFYTSFMEVCMIWVNLRLPVSVLNKSLREYTSANSIGLENNIWVMQSLV